MTSGNDGVRLRRSDCLSHENNSPGSDKIGADGGWNRLDRNPCATPDLLPPSSQSHSHLNYCKRRVEIPVPAPFHRSRFHKRYVIYYARARSGARLQDHYLWNNLR
jgi:hypothetical protein